MEESLSAARTERREGIVREQLQRPVASVEVLRSSLWNGQLSPALRAEVWKLLLSYAPAEKARREQAISSKREEYYAAIDTLYVQEALDQDLIKDIAKDIPRTHPEIPLFRNEYFQRSMSRLLYVWSATHKACGYVQSLNEICSPLLSVLIRRYDPKMDENEFEEIPEIVLKEVEADAYWCLSIILRKIQDFYLPHMPGVQRCLNQVEELVRRIQPDLVVHIKSEGVDFHVFGVRWLSCMFLREFPFQLSLRVWDSFIAEENGFARFSVYFAVALLTYWREELMARSFADVILLLQNLPTHTWSEEQLMAVVSQAYQYKLLFEPSPNHLR